MALSDSLGARLTEIEAELVPARTQAALASPARLLAQYNTLYGTLVGDGGYGSGSAEGRPSAGRLRRKGDLDPQWSAIRRRLDMVIGSELSLFNQEVARRSLGGVIVPPLSR